MKRTAQYWIDKLNLDAHPEGGYYREVYRADLKLAQASLPGGFTGARSAATGIFYLLRHGEKSLFHRIKSDETWQFCFGDPLELWILSEQNRGKILVGNDLDKGQHLVATVPAQAWMGARPAPASDYSLLTCFVAPGFDFEDFEFADRSALSAEHPDSTEIIELLTTS